MHMILNSIAALTAAFIAACAQVLLKQSANKQIQKKEKLISKFLNFKVIAAYLLLLSSTALNVYAFSKLELKYAQVFDVTSIIWVAILAYIILEENITKWKLIAIGLVIMGSIIFCI